MRGGHGEKNGESPRLIVFGMKGLEKRFLKVMVLANGDKGLFHFRRRYARTYLKEKVQPTPMIEPVKKITISLADLSFLSPQVPLKSTRSFPSLSSILP